MENTILLKLSGYEANIPARAFVTAINSFLKLLQDLDAAISNDKRGTIEWEIAALSKQSPAQIGYVGKSHLADRSNVKQVGYDCVRGLQMLARSADRIPTYSDSAIYRTHTLARLTRRDLSLINVEADDDEATVTQSVEENINTLTKETAQEEGSIVGRLESINVHRGNEFRVWDDNTKKPVTCRFPNDLFDKAREALKQRVMIVGMTKINKLGNIISVSVTDIEKYPSDSELPTIEDMSGSIKDLTGDLSLHDYMKTIRED